LLLSLQVPHYLYAYLFSFHISCFHFYLLFFINLFLVFCISKPTNTLSFLFLCQKTKKHLCCCVVCFFSPNQRATAGEPSSPGIRSSSPEFFATSISPVAPSNWVYFVCGSVWRSHFCIIIRGFSFSQRLRLQCKGKEVPVAGGSVGSLVSEIPVLWGVWEIRFFVRFSLFWMRSVGNFVEVGFLEFLC